VTLVLQATDTTLDTRTRVVVADGQPLFREALRKAFLDVSDILVVGEAGDGDSAADVLAGVAPDVVLVDNEIGWRVERLEAGYASPPVVVLAEDEDLESLIAALEAGAAGFVAKRRPLPELIAAIRAVHAGHVAVPEPLLGPLIRHFLGPRGDGAIGSTAQSLESALSPQAREILTLLGSGADGRSIVETLLGDPQTAVTPEQNIVVKLPVDTPAAAASVPPHEGIVTGTAATRTSAATDGEPRVIRRPDPTVTEASDQKTGPDDDRGRTTIRRYQLVASGLAASDAGCLILALALTKWLVAPRALVLSPLLVLVVALWLGVVHLFGLYGIQRLSAAEEFRKIISATGVGVAVVAVAASWGVPTLTRSWIASTWAVAVLLHLAERRLWRRAIYKLRCRRWLAYRTLVVGTNREAHTLAQTLMDPSLGFVPMGYVSTSDVRFETGGFPVVSAVADLDRTIRDRGIECVFVASTAVNADEMYRVTRACRRANVEMRVSANLPEILTSRVAIQHIDRVMALSVRPVRLTRTQALVKRSFDVVLATGALVVLSPIIVLLAGLVVATSGRPVFFGQRRVTKDGRVFTLFKLRTMVTDQQRVLADQVIDLSQPFFKLEDDPRLTRIGRILRLWSLDELPQLWNVVRGQMSLVGPRPLPIEQVGANAALLAPRQEVRAGITGWWQIQGRGDAAPEEAVEMDLYYIENWSLYLDLYILLKTIGAVARRKGAV
jgi:exopolysaccharide biosynthesis polyprenyl glycosylphosphotransferase